MRELWEVIFLQRVLTRPQGHYDFTAQQLYCSRLPKLQKLLILAKTCEK